MLFPRNGDAFLAGGRPVNLRRSPALAQAPAARPSGIIGKFDASEALGKLKQVVEKAPECWEGEDLTAAQGLLSRLETFATSSQALMGLSEEEEEVLQRGLNCFLALERTKQAESAAAPSGSAPTSSGISPLVPIGIAAGAALALVLILK